jgi:hypothetical protein
LQTQTNNNEKFILDMLAIFKNQLPVDLKIMEQAIQELNFLGIYKSAHSIRNSVNLFGLNKYIGQDLLQIEKWAHANEKWEEIQTYFIRIRDICDLALEEINLT